MPHLSLSFLGGFQVRLDGLALTAFGSEKARALLAYLAIESGRPHRRAELAAMFWADLPEKKAAHNLSQSLLRIRRALRQDKGAVSTHQPFLVITPQDVQFNMLSSTELDVARFLQLLAARAEHHPPDADICPVCVEWLQQATDLYRGDLLAGFFVRDSVAFQEWRLEQQEHLHRLALRALANLIAYHAPRGEQKEVEAYARRQIALEPWDEEPHKHLMRALAQTGQRSLALQQFDTFRRVIADEFGIEPSAEVVALYKELKRPAGDGLAAGNPGADEPRAVSLGERRQASVLACGPAGAAAQGDPEDLLEHLAVCREACDLVLKRYGGHRLPRQGSECLVLFGYPHAAEDASRRAVEAGLRMAQTLQGSKPVSVGIHTGEIVTGEHTPQREPDLMGTAPDVARQVRALAAPGTVLVTADTQRQVQVWFECEPLPTPIPIGLAQSVPVYHVRGETRFSTRLEWLAHTRRLTAFVGRASELETLEAVIAQQRRGQGPVVLVQGDQGIGKSRLVLELKNKFLRGEVRATHKAPPRWLTVHCAPSFQNSSLHPIIELLEQLLGFDAQDTRESRRDKLTRVLARSDLSHPSAQWLVTKLLGLDAEHTPEMITAEQRARMRELFVALVQTSAREHPLVLEVEDLHWSDPSTIEWLGLSLEALAAAPCCVLLTARPSFQPPWMPGAAWRALPLDPLSREESHQMVLDLSRTQALDPFLREHIVRQTDGVPLFVEELTRMVLEVGPATHPHTERRALLPTTLRDSLMARLDRLGSARETIGWAAVLGRDFAYAELQVVVPFDEPRLQSDVERLMAADLIQPVDTHGTRWRFKHALIQQVAYGTLLKRTRTSYHRRLAETLETRFPRIARTQPEVLAHHFTNANLAPRAADYWMQAGEYATAQGATLEAKPFFDRALELVEAHDLERRWRALQGRERVLDLRAERAAQKADLDALLELADAFGDDTRRARVYLLQTSFAGRQGDYRATLPLADAAMAAGRRAGDLALELHALSYKTQTQIFFREMETARQGVQEALGKLDALTDNEVRARVLTTAAQYYLETGDLARAAEMQTRSAAAARLSGNRNVELTVLANLGLIYTMAGFFREARRTLEEGRARAEMVGDRRLAANVLRHLGYVYWKEGDVALGSRTQAQALDELNASRDVYGAAASLAYLGYMQEDGDHPEMAADSLARARAMFAEIGVDPDVYETQAVQARVALAQGDKTQGQTLAQQVWEYSRENGSEDFSLPSLVYTCLADVFLQQERAEDTARQVIETGYRELMQRANKLGDAEWRKSFLENVPENRALVERWASVFRPVNGADASGDPT